MAIKIYEVNPQYIDYLIPYAPHLFQDKQPGQHNERKYIGIVLYVNIPTVKNPQYRKLLMTEYRIIRKLQDKIMKNAEKVYKHKLNNGDTTALAKRCNDFKLLEEKSKKFNSNSHQ